MKDTDSVYVALKHVNYEGDEFLGVYSTEDRGMAACEADYQRDGSESYVWAWVGHGDVWYGGAKADNIVSYTVTETLLDEW